MYREMGMTYWREKAEAEMRESAWSSFVYRFQGRRYTDSRN
jgi:hypothetical protein